MRIEYELGLRWNVLTGKKLDKGDPEEYGFIRGAGGGIFPVADPEKIFIEKLCYFQHVYKITISRKSEENNQFSIETFECKFKIFLNKFKFNRVLAEPLNNLQEGFLVSLRI